MIIPNLPSSQKITDKDGNLSAEWFQFFSSLVNALQQTISDEGILIPTQTAANITRLDTTKSARRLLFDSDNDVAKVNLTGTFKTIQTA